MVTHEQNEIRSSGRAVWRESEGDDGGGLNTSVVLNYESDEIK